MAISKSIPNSYYGWKFRVALYSRKNGNDSALAMPSGACFPPSAIGISEPNVEGVIRFLSDRES